MVDVSEHSNTCLRDRDNDGFMSVTGRLSTGRNIPEHLTFMSHGICVLVSPVVISLTGSRLCR